MRRDSEVRASEVAGGVEAVAGATGGCGVSAGEVAASVAAVSSGGASFGSAAAAPVLHAPAPRRRGNRRRMLVALVAAGLLLAAVAVVGALSVPAAVATDFSQKSLAPCLAHPFGTDWMGRDMLARTLAGLSTSIRIGLLAAGVSTLIALALALVASLGGRVADAVVLWLVDLLMGIPHIVLMVLVSYALGRGVVGVTVAVAVTHWPSLARVLRAEVLQLRGQPFVQLGLAAGVSRMRMALRHLLPAVLPQLFAGLLLMFPHAILHEASVTFLGFGLPSGEPAIGVILSESMGYLSTGLWWLAVFPGMALLVVVLAFDRVGSVARRLADARSVQE